MRQRLHVWRRRTAGTMAIVGAGLMALGALSTTADAAPALRVGWWNTATANGAAAPSPTTPTGGIHVAAGSGTAQTQVPGTVPNPPGVAYGALLYVLPAGPPPTPAPNLPHPPPSTPPSH